MAHIQLQTLRAAVPYVPPWTVGTTFPPTNLRCSAQELCNIWAPTLSPGKLLQGSSSRSLTWVPRRYVQPSPGKERIQYIFYMAVLRFNAMELVSGWIAQPGWKAFGRKEEYTHTGSGISRRVCHLGWSRVIGVLEVQVG